jgi:hypothetical protein
VLFRGFGHNVHVAAEVILDAFYAQIKEHAPGRALRAGEVDERDV